MKAEICRIEVALPWIASELLEYFEIADWEIRKLISSRQRRDPIGLFEMQRSGVYKSSDTVRITLFLIILSFSACAVSNNPLRKEVKRLQKGIVKDDTSYVYSLPFEEGAGHRIVQGYFGPWSHKERAALDFKMKRGTRICAIRGGVVTRVKEDGDRGGWNRKYRPYGNNIIIQHADGSRAGYWHLQKDGALVNVGDTVKQGQVIALSGKTGYAAMPHLHLLVWTSRNGNWQQVATRFQTSKGIKYLRGWKKYRNSGNPEAAAAGF